MPMLVGMLQNATRTAHHEFGSDEICLLDPLPFQQVHIQSTRQLRCMPGPAANGVMALPFSAVVMPAWALRHVSESA